MVSKNQGQTHVNLSHEFFILSKSLPDWDRRASAERVGF